MHQSGRDARTRPIVKTTRVAGSSWKTCVVLLRGLLSKLKPAKYTLAREGIIFAIVSLFVPGSVFLAGLFAPKPVQAATSSTLNFQARLLQTSGSLVADGTYNIQFNLYDVSSAGTALWTETRLNNASQGVTVKNGYLSVNLGSLTSFPSTINWDQELWLGMTVRGTGSCVFGSCTPTDSEMTPRFKLTAVPYALSAGQLQKTNGANNLYVTTATPTADVTYVFQDAAAGSYNVCTTASVCTGYAASSGSGSYIQNGTSIQTNANFAIQSAAAGSIGAVIRGHATQSADILVVENSAGTDFLAVQADGDLAVDGDALFVDITNNRVGIGNASPNAPLHVTGTTAGSIITQLQLTNSGTSAGTGTAIVFNNSTTVGHINARITSQRSASADGDLRFWTHDASSLNERLRIESDGDIVVDTNTLFVDATNNRVALGTTTTTNAGLTVSLNAPNVANGAGLLVDGSLSSTTNSQAGALITPAIAPGGASTESYIGLSVQPVSSSTNLSGATITGVSSLPLLTGTGGIAVMTGGIFGVVSASSGTVAEAVGIAAINNVGTITSSIGVRSVNQTNGTNNTNLLINDGSAAPTGNWNIYSTSTYNSALAGNLRVGGTTAPTVALDVTGAGTFSGLLTGNLGTTISGATINLNASSNFDTNINTGTSTGAVSIGNTLAGTVSIGSSGQINLFGNGGTTGLEVGSTLTSSLATFRFSGTSAKFIRTAINGSGSSADLTIDTGESGGTSTSSGVLTITSGNGTGTTTNSGNVTIDVGTATGTAGTVSLGATNTSAITLGRTGITTTNAGALTVTQVLTANGNTTIGNANTDTLAITAGSSGSGITLSDTSFANCTLTTVANVLTCGAGGGSSLFTDAGTHAYLTATTDNLTLGSTSAGGKLFIDGDTDEIQLQVQANATQTADIFVVENSAGTDYLAVQGDGDIVADTDTLFIDATGNRVGIGTASPDGKLEIAGNLSQSAWGLNGIQLQATSATYTDSSTAASGTATNAVFNSFGQPTLAATNTSVTTTNAATVYIQNAPAAGTNQTITNSYALWVDAGYTRLDGNLSVGQGATADSVLSIYGNEGNAGTISGINAFGGSLLRFQASGVSNSVADFRDCCNAVAYIGTTGNASGFNYGLDIAGTLNANDNVVLGASNVDLLTVNAVLQGASPLVFEGATANGFETTFAVTDPTADQTITFTNATGTVVLDTVLTTEGDIYYRNGSGLTRLARGANGECLTSNTTTILWGSCGSGGANTALSNLASTAINVSLLPGTDDSIDLGDNTHRFRDLYLGGETIHIGTSTTDEGTIAYNTTSNILQFGTDGTTNGDIAFFTDDLYLDKATGFVGIGTTASDARLEIAGNQTAAAWGLSGIQLQATSATYTDSSTAASGTATNAVFNSFGRPTLAASNTSVTTTNAATVYIQNSPLAGTNQTITNAYSLWVDNGNVKFDDEVYALGKLGVGTNAPTAKLEVDGGLTAANWATGGIQLRVMSNTFTDSSTAASGTAAVAVISSFNQPTLAATNAGVTTTNAATVYIANAPAAGTNMTITNAYSLWVAQGTTRLDGNVQLGDANTDTLTINAGSSGTGITLAHTSFANCGSLTTVSNVVTCGSAGGGANTALSNLASTAINVSLLPGTDDSIDLGDNTHRFRDLFLGGESIHIGTSTTDEGLISYNTTTNLFSLQSTGNIAIGTSDTTGTLLVLDTKTGSGDPTGVDGGLYYNSNEGDFKAYQNGTWGFLKPKRYVFLTADRTNATTSFADVTDLSFSIDANRNYELECSLVYQSNTQTVGLGYSLTGPASPNLVSGLFTAQASATTAGAMGFNAYDAGSFTQSVPTANANAHGFLRAYIRNGANSGTLQLRFKAETTGTVTTKADSYCTITEL